MITPAQSHYHEGSPMSKEEKLRWKGTRFVEKVLSLEWKSEGVVDVLSMEFDANSWPVTIKSWENECFNNFWRLLPGVWWQGWRWWQGWVDKWTRRWIETGFIRLTKWIWKLILKTRWCISCVDMWNVNASRWSWQRRRNVNFCRSWIRRR